MPAITILTKTHDGSRLGFVDRNLRDMLEGLKVRARVKGVSDRGWVEVDVSGEDEKAALNYIIDHIGLCPNSLDGITKNSAVKGFITSLGKSEDAVRVDVGITLPHVVDALLSLQSLQSQLCDGRKIALAKIIRLYGFCDNLPLVVKITDTVEKDGLIESTLSGKQLDQYKRWILSRLDKLLIVGASLPEVEFALGRIEAERDIISVESLGMFEHSITCKLGTDGVGLIPKIGRYLRNATISLFSPRRILEFFGEEFVSS
jgi:hypothetical protein